jgi:hypothetical protein
VKELKQRIRKYHRINVIGDELGLDEGEEDEDEDSCATADGEVSDRVPMEKGLRLRNKDFDLDGSDNHDERMRKQDGVEGHGRETVKTVKRVLKEGSNISVLFYLGN